jgi:hypothetical protein
VWCSLCTEVGGPAGDHGPEHIFRQARKVLQVLRRCSVSSNAGSTTVSIGVTVPAQGLFRVLEPLLPRMIPSKWREYSERLLQTQPPS